MLLERMLTEKDSHNLLVYASSLLTEKEDTKHE
jgi:hypothetical protein